MSLSAINALIKSFTSDKSGFGLNPYTVDITPKHINDGKIKGTAAQKWWLLVHLPLIFHGMNFPENYRPLELLLKCRELGAILLADSIPKSVVEYLRYLIHYHHTLVREISPNSITPKFHFLIHYPSIIQRFGPPRRYWTMRFESKHQYFKDLARKCKNFKNITYTLSTRCQNFQAVTLNSEILCNNEVKCGPGERLTLSDLEDDLSEVLKNTADLGFFDNDIVYSCQWLNANGVSYRKGCVLVTALVHEDIPLFTKVDFIINIRGEWYLGGKELTPQQFDRQTWSFVCKEASTLQFQALDSLFSRSPALCYQLDGVNHVALVTNV